MKKLKIISLLSVILAFILMALSLKLPTPAGIKGGEIGFHISLGLDILIVCLDTGAGVLFLYGLKDFKPQLKVAYILICLGIIFFGLANIQLPIFQILNGFQSKWITSGGIQILYFLSALFMYSGLRHFAKLIEVKSRLNSIFWVTGSLLFFGFVFALISYFNPLPQDIYGLSTGFTALNSVFLSISAGIIIRLKSKAGPTFTNVLAWLFIAKLFGALALWQVVVLQFIGFNNVWVNSGFFALIYVINGILFQKAGHAFNKITRF